MDPDVPLSVPEVNPEALEGWPHPGIIAVPNCTAITAVLALGPLHRAAGCVSLVLSSYQAVSGAGMKGTRELAEQVDKLGGDIESLAHPDATLCHRARFSRSRSPSTWSRRSGSSRPTASPARNRR